MKTITVKVPDEVKNATQRADIECAARKDIIVYLMEKNLAIPPERLEAYQKEYEDKFLAFEQAKSNIEQNYVRTAVAKPINWNLDYSTNIVTITAED